MKNTLFAALFALFCLGLLELGSALVYRAQFDSWYSYSAQRESAAKVAGIDPAATQDDIAALRNPNGGNDRYFLHPFSGFTGKPFADKQYNGFGYRGPSPLAAKEPGQLFVAVAGGSVAAQLFHYAGDVLENELERVYGRDIVLISVALGGMKQPQQLMAITYMLTLGAPLDVVINIDGYNEGVLSLDENHRRGSAPFFPRAWNVYAQQALDLDRAVLIGNLARLREEQVNLARLASGPVGYSVFAGTAWEVLNNRKATAVFRAEQALANPGGRPGTQPAHIAGPIKEYGDTAAVDRLVVDVWANASRQLAGVARANGMEYYHFLQPNQYVAGSKPFSAKEERLLLGDDDPAAAIARRIYPQLIERMAVLPEQTGIAAFDLTQIYSEEEQTLYVDSCCHVNTEGYAILARAVARDITNARSP